MVGACESKEQGAGQMPTLAQNLGTEKNVLWIISGSPSVTAPPYPLCPIIIAHDPPMSHQAEQQTLISLGPSLP